MKNSKVRRQIAWQAAKLMYEREESEYYRAKMKAARKVCQGWVAPRDLPSNAEIRDEIQQFARLIEGEDRTQNLKKMRLAALGLMRILSKFRPRIIGSVYTGHIRQGSDIDLHLFSSSVQAITSELDYQNLQYDVTRKSVRKNGEETTYRHIHVHDQFEFELTVYPESKSSYSFKSSITGKPIEKASLPQFEAFLRREYPGIDLETELLEVVESVDRFQVFESLLLPLEKVKQNPHYHPEGDALYHSLQVYDRACDHQPYDEEFLLAALLHDVGKGLNRYDHVNAGLQALEGFITERTTWLIANHMLAHQIHDRSIGARKLRRLRENENFDDLVLLGQCDRDGRLTGVRTTELEEALEYIRGLATAYG